MRGWNRWEEEGRMNGRMHPPLQKPQGWGNLATVMLVLVMFVWRKIEWRAGN